MVFEVDCGEVLPGHRLVATGLRRDGMSNDDIHADYSGHTADRPVHAMASLTYRITPALPETEAGRDIDATVRLCPPANPAFWDRTLTAGAERDAVSGSAVTAGAFGPFVVPDRTDTVTVRLVDVAISSGNSPAPDSGPARDLGDVVVDLRNGTAEWRPHSPGSVPDGGRASGAVASP